MGAAIRCHEVRRTSASSDVHDVWASPRAGAATAAKPACSAGLRRVTLERRRDTTFGVRVLHVQGMELGVLVCRVVDGCSLSRWNEANPSRAVTVGNRIVAVNGLESPWSIMEEMTKALRLEMDVLPTPPGAEKYVQNSHGMDRSMKLTRIILNHTVQAGDIRADECSICMEGMDPNERVAGLGCGHGFHQACIRSWIGVKEEAGCPLCRYPISS